MLLFYVVKSLPGTLVLICSLKPHVRVIGAPYAIIPSDSTLRYEVELLRLSSKGPDALTEGISRCGTGGAAASAEQCDKIDIAEFI